MNWYFEALRKYGVFDGRSRRREYWTFYLLSSLLGFALGVLDLLMGTFNLAAGVGLFSSLFALALFVPGLAVGVRRLHDTDRSGWWLLVALVPILGVIVLIVFLLQGGTPGPNRFGPDPRADAAA